MSLLRCENLTRRFGDRDVVQGVSLTIEEGDSVALVGPSGSGKTTLLQLLGILDRPTSGSVFLAERDIWSLTGAERAALRLRNLGFVFQQHHLLGHLTALENVAIPLWRLTGSRAQAMREAALLLERMGLAGRAKARASLLSGGEAQRVAIARAIAHRPHLVLADEPTGALDSKTAQSVLDILEQFRSQHMGLLMVTHNMEVAARFPRIIHLKDGHIEPPVAAVQT